MTRFCHLKTWCISRCSQAVTQLHPLLSTQRADCTTKMAPFRTKPQDAPLTCPMPTTREPRAIKYSRSNPLSNRPTSHRLHEVGASTKNLWSLRLYRQMDAGKQQTCFCFRPQIRKVAILWISKSNWEAISNSRTTMWSRRLKQWPIVFLRVPSTAQMSRTCRTVEVEGIIISI
jgi:hypothetical protein